MAQIQDYIAAIELLKRRVRQLERVLFSHNIPIPKLDAAADEDEAPFPTLEFPEPPPKIPKKLDVRSALEDMPRLCHTIVTIWGAKEIDDFLRKLIIDDRGGRQGFPPEMMEELLLLGGMLRAKALLFGMPTPIELSRQAAQEKAKAAG